MKPYLVFAIFSASLGAMQFGWNLAVLNNLSGRIAEFINQTEMTRNDGVPTEKQFTERIFTVITAIFAASGIFGAFFNGRLADSIGRRRGMMWNNLLVILAAILMIISKYAASYELLIVARIFIGFAVAVFSGLVPMYLTEMAPLELRGALGVVNQFGVTLGILSAQVATLNTLLGSELLWNWALGVTGFIAAVHILLLWFCPDSPVYSLVIRDNLLATQIVLESIRDISQDEIQDEIQRLKQQQSQFNNTKSISWTNLICTKVLRKFLLIGIAMHLSQQLSGITNVLFYSNYVFQEIGVDSYMSQFSTIGIGATMVLLTGISVPLIEVAGRRLLHLSGLLGLTMFCVLFTIFNHIEDAGMTYKYVVIACVLCFVIAFSIGPGSIPWMFMSEIFDDASRTKAMSLGATVNWLANFSVGLVFIDLSNLLGKNVMIPFAIINMSFFLLLYFCMPETKNRSAADILTEHGYQSISS